MEALASTRAPPSTRPMPSLSPRPIRRAPTASRSFPSAACSSWRAAHEACARACCLVVLALLGFGPARPRGAAGDGGRRQSPGGRGRAGCAAPRRLGGRCRDRRADGARRGRAAGLGHRRRRLPAALRRAPRAAIAVYDGRETAPAGASPDMFLDADGKPLGMLGAVVSGISVGVPGAVAMLELAHKEHGKLAWRELFQPAIDSGARGLRGAAAAGGWLQRDVRPTIPTSARSTSMPMARPRSRASGSPIPRSPRRCSADRRAGRARLLRRRHRARDGRAGAQARAAGHAVARPISPTTSRSSASRCAGPIASGSSAACRRRRRAASPSCRCWACSNPSSCGATSPTTCARCISSPRRAGSPSPTATATSPIRRSSRCRRQALLSPAYLAERRKLISPDRSMGVRRSRRAAGLCRARHQPHHHRRSLGQCRRLHHHHRGAVRLAHHGEGLLAEQRAHRFLGRCPSCDGKPVANRVEPGKRPRSSMSPTFVLDRDRKLFCRPWARPAGAHHRRHLADRDRPARLEPVHAGRPRPAACHQHERRHRARGRHADCGPGRRLARAGRSSTSPPA